ncbi:PKD domain-containing protein [Lacihabitans sp. LS3-19]|uniref:PKD domain-containing protein n=1 Tax=Lacihabitans sp. LS3-19 TaxID=2487335 RepID=UPI0020CF0153|nr:PKD domain-containing protein [Lacihabitans sp. LS3-19]MCP9767678.1 PKD domain-containing protein [Lacihabitans sp. LS3-19]
MKLIKSFLLIVICLPLWSFGQNHINSYEYWFDNNYAQKILTQVTPAATLDLSTNIPTDGLASGIHTLHFRAMDDLGKYSSTQSQFFYKVIYNQITQNEIDGYEYWIDNDYLGKTTVASAVGETINLNAILDFAGIPVGLHTLNIRFKDKKSIFSITQSQFFYKIKPQAFGSQNLIVAFEYWFNDDFAGRETVVLNQPLQQIHLLENLDLSEIPAGNYILNYRFKDTIDQWSSVTSDEIQKLVIPKAIFSFSKTENCDSTVFTFTNASVDANSYLWDFGDGQTSTLVNPEHTFYYPGAFTVSLKAIDSQSLLENTTEEPFKIKGNTSYAFQVQSCGPYTSPSGKYVWNTTGTYLDTLVKADGCDSLITINLAVNPVVIPNAPIATSVARCGPGILTLTASGCNSTIIWYETATSDEVLATGNTFVTPNLVVSREYFVACTENTCISNRTAVSAMLNIDLNHPAGTLPPGVYKVSNQIVSRASINGNSTYQAANSLVLLPGFQVSKGITFKAVILGCD